MKTRKLYSGVHHLVVGAEFITSDNPVVLARDNLLIKVGSNGRQSGFLRKKRRYPDNLANGHTLRQRRRRSPPRGDQCFA